MTTLIMAVKETIGGLNQRFKNQDTSIFFQLFSLWLYQSCETHNRWHNELRQFAQNWAFLQFTNFKRRK